MRPRTSQFTSESVSEGHPDKICDQISDAILDACLKRDPGARVACETVVTTGTVILVGEMRYRNELGGDEIEAIVRRVIRDIGYEQESFHWERVGIRNCLHRQSPDIAEGVDRGNGRDEGAGDQGIMFGFACDETSALMPAPIHYAHRILRALARARRDGRLDLGPDAKSQVTVNYDGDGRPAGIAAIVISTQHAPGVSQAEIRALAGECVREVLPPGWSCPPGAFHVNPAGRFVVGGPDGDAGLTGRKIVVDTYGGAAPHGGGAFSGKDPSKVDRSAAYACRYLARNVVAAGLARKCLIQVAYAIGVPGPLSLSVRLSGGRVDPARLEQLFLDGCFFELTPRGIRKVLGLDRPIYEGTAAYGHFGREPGEDGSFSWERTDLAGRLGELVS